jgi:predicted small secreted protein
MNKALTLLTVLLGLTLLSGCNTVAGIGKDVQKGGQILQDAAKK